MREKNGFTMNRKFKRKNINLLPENIKREICLNKTLDCLITLSGLFFILMLAAYFIFSYANGRLYVKTDSFVARLNSGKYDGAEQAYEKIAWLKEEINRVEELISQINNPKFVSGANFGNIFSLLPEGVYAQNVSLYAHEGKITLSGVSGDRDKLSDFVGILQASDKFERIDLKSLTSSGDGGIYFTVAIYPV